MHEADKRFVQTQLHEREVRQEIARSQFGRKLDARFQGGRWAENSRRANLACAYIVGLPIVYFGSKLFLGDNLFGAVLLLIGLLIIGTGHKLAIVLNE